MIYAHLGFGQPPAVTAEALQECGLRTGFPPEICQELLTVTAGDVDIAWLIAEAGITTAGAAACVKGLEAKGIPPRVSMPMCEWAAENLWDLLFEYLPTRGGPTWHALQTGREGVHWRRCASPGTTAGSKLT